MAQQSGSGSSGDGSSALEREADHIDKLMNSGQSGTASKETKEGASGLNNPIQIEQDNRVEKAKAEARAAGDGPDQPENNLNQDG